MPIECNETRTQTLDVKMPLAKLKEYKITKRGLRGLIMTLPQVWIVDQKLRRGDLLCIFRDTDTDDLVIRKADNGATA